LYFTSPLVCRLSPRWKETSFRFLDLPPDQLVATGLRGAFEIAVHFGKIDWPGTWVSEKAGRSEWLLCARAGHRLPARAPLESVLRHPFVVPTYWTAEGLVEGDDQFPLPFSRRLTGFETATADGAVPILLQTDHVAFLPALLVRPFLDRGELKVLSPPDLRRVDREIWVSVRSDSVPAPFFRELLLEMRQELRTSVREGSFAAR
jgi:DNA-binding transcriptional LysR family regulator